MRKPSFLVKRCRVPFTYPSATKEGVPPRRASVSLPSLQTRCILSAKEHLLEWRAGRGRRWGAKVRCRCRTSGGVHRDLCYSSVDLCQATYFLAGKSLSFCQVTPPWPLAAPEALPLLLHITPPVEIPQNINTLVQLLIAVTNNSAILPLGKYTQTQHSTFIFQHYFLASI